MLHPSPSVVLSPRLLTKDRTEDSKGFWLASSLTHPSTETGWLRNRFKFFARAWLTPRLSREWLTCLARPEMGQLWQLRPRLASKLQRPYQCVDLSSRQRLDVLLAHYTLLPRVAAAPARALIYGEGYPLLRIRHAVTTRELQLRLFYRDQFEKEGELTLGVFEASAETMLAGITFSLGQAKETRTAFIGGLQASPSPETRVLIHDVTKEMYGMRPKAFALWCLQALLTQWGVNELHAVGDDQHIYRHWRKRRQITASYNEFWTESEGVLDGSDGLWTLPLKSRVRPREELKPSRRKAHERRYAMLSEIELCLSGAITRLASYSGAEPSSGGAPVFEYGAPSSPCPTQESGEEEAAPRSHGAREQAFH